MELHSMSEQNSTGTGVKSTGTIREAADAFESLMVVVDSGGNQIGDEAKPDDEAEAKAEADSQGSEEEAQAEEAEADSEEQVEQDEGEPEEQAPPQKFTVRIDGKDVEVEQSELIAGYSRTADYTRKTQQVAEQRKAVETELASVRQERAEYQALLPKLRAALEAGVGPEPDWVKLRAEDPAKAAVMWQEREEVRRKLDLAKQEEQRVAQQTAADRQRETEAILLEQRNQLLEKLPEWRDEKVAGVESAMIHKTLLDAGFSEQEAEIYDHRAVLIARKAAKYDALMAQRDKVQKKVVNAPVNRSKGTVQTSAGKEQHKQAVSRFKKTGSVRDAASVFESFLS